MRLSIANLTALILGGFTSWSTFAAQLSTARAPQTTTGTAAFTRQASPVAAQTTQVGARVGYTNVDRLEGGTLGIGASIEHAAADNLLLGLTIDHWNDSSGSTDLYQSIQVRDTVFGAHAKMLFTQFDLPVRPFALVGLTAHRLTVKTTKPITPNETEPRVNMRTDTGRDTEGQLGVDLGGGISYPVNQEVDLTAELRWRNILEDAVRYDQLALTGGVSYLL